LAGAIFSTFSWSENRRAGHIGSEKLFGSVFIHVKWVDGIPTIEWAYRHEFFKDYIWSYKPIPTGNDLNERLARIYSRAHKQMWPIIDACEQALSKLRVEVFLYARFYKAIDWKLKELERGAAELFANVLHE
jgi:hypothetical protein